MARSAPALFLHSFLCRLGQNLPAAALFNLRPLIDLPRMVRLLVLQLVVARQTAWQECAGHDRTGNGASRFLAMPAIAELAVRGKRVDIFECCGYIAALPQLQLAHPGGVDEYAPLRQWNQLTRRARVASAAIRVTHLLSPEEVVPDQLIDDG